MTIETKFNAQDKVYVLRNLQAEIGIIKGIEININCNEHLCIDYFIEFNKNEKPEWYSEKEIFSTKDELIKFILSDIS
mgnify:CR=1 FL=1